MLVCLCCGKALTPLTHYSHGICIDCCEESVIKAKKILEKLREK